MSHGYSTSRDDAEFIVCYSDLGNVDSIKAAELRLKLVVRCQAREQMACSDHQHEESLTIEQHCVVLMSTASTRPDSLTTCPLLDA
jgi:hypothetical protein